MSKFPCSEACTGGWCQVGQDVFVCDGFNDRPVKYRANDRRPSQLPAAQAVAGGTHTFDRPVDLLITANERAALARFLDCVPLCYFEEQGQHDQFHLETLAIRMRSYL